MFPLPGERDAVGVHKKHYPDGCVASKLSKAKADSALLRRYLPSVDLNFPGLRVLHLDPPVLIVDDFFSLSYVAPPKSMILILVLAGTICIDPS